MQEFKRSIIFKRYARCRNANLNKIIFDKKGLYAHWIILCKKVISYRTYQGKDKKVIEKLKETFEDIFIYPPIQYIISVERRQEPQIPNLQHDAGNKGDTESMVEWKNGKILFPPFS